MHPWGLISSASQHACGSGNRKKNVWYKNIDIHSFTLFLLTHFSQNIRHKYRRNIIFS